MPPTVDLSQLANQHAQLLQQLSKFDNAPAELKNVTQLIESVEKDLNERQSNIGLLIDKRKSEHEDVDKLQRSGTRRFLVRLTQGGKEGLARKIEKEEREFIEAEQKEHNEVRAIAELKATMENAQKTRIDLSEQINLKKKLKQELDEIYRSAFEGPSPDFPEEDAAEHDFQEAEKHFENMQARLSQERDVFDLLDKAASCANEAQSLLQSASIAAKYKTYNVGPNCWGEIAEAENIGKAQTLISEALRLNERAHAAQPLVHIVQCGKLVSPDWLNVVFESMFTDFMFQKKIEKSIETMREYQKGIFEQCAASEARKKEHERNAKEAYDFFKAQRRTLFDVRREILQRVCEDGATRVIAEGGSGPELPKYTKQLEAGLVTKPAPVHESQSPPSYESIVGQPKFPRAGGSSNVNTITSLPK